MQEGQRNVRGGEAAIARVAAPPGRAALTRAGDAVRARLGAEAAIFIALALWSVLPFAILFLTVKGGGLSLYRGHGVFDGSAGLQVGDHMQYLAWIRDAGDHVLIANRFDVVQDKHIFLHPVFLISGLIWKLGASLQFANLVWKPFVLVLLFAGFAAYVRRLVEGAAARAATLVLSLFFFTPATALVNLPGLGSHSLQFGTKVMGLEMFPAGYTWGGASPGAISVALMPLFLLGVERLLDTTKRAPGRSTGWYLAWTSAAGLLAAWLHPWQGTTLLVIVGGLVAWDRLDRRNLILAAPVAATTAPVLYMFALSHTHTSWAAASHPGHYSHLGLWLVLGLAPLLLALPGAPGSTADVQERLLRLWPVAAIVVYFGLQESWFYHALAGVSLPLAILGVRGWRRLRLSPALGVALIALLTLPGMAWAVRELRDSKPDHFFAYGESDALDYLEHSPRPGAVLAPERLGLAVPAFANRNTWLGHYSWTPDYGPRLARAEALFSGRLAGTQARELVRESRASFVLSDCRHHADLRPQLRPILSSVRRFGCATLYVVAARG